MKNGVLSINGLEFSYPGTTSKILDEINFNVNENEILVVLGQSGCGKTTLFKNMLGLYKPDKGSIFVENQILDSDNIDNLKTYYKKIGVLFQSGALLNSLSIYENLELPLIENTSLPSYLRKIMIELKLKWVGLENSSNLMPSELSGGMKKRVALARAIMLDPKIVFFDEPHAGLDPLIIKDINELILKIRNAFKMSMLVITHDINSALNLADRILMLKNGKIYFLGNTDEFSKLFETDTYIKNFIYAANQINVKRKN